jgi:vacuolar-type H+-ATPase subunit I/STV1
MSEPLATIKKMVGHHIKRFDEDITYIKETLSKLKVLSNSSDKELTNLIIESKILRTIDKIDDLFRDIIFLPERLKNVFSVVEGEPSYKRFEKRLNELIPLRDQIDKYLDKLVSIRDELSFLRDYIIDDIFYQLNVDELDEFLIKNFLEE